MAQEYRLISVLFVDLVGLTDRADTTEPEITARDPARFLRRRGRGVSHVHQSPVGRIGVQLYPCGIASRYRNTPAGLARPIG